MCELLACGYVGNPRYNIMKTLFGNKSYSLTRDIIPLDSENSTVKVFFDFDVHQILELVCTTGCATVVIVIIQ